jgi:chromosome segregation ATPase
VRSSQLAPPGLSSSPVPPSPGLTAQLASAWQQELVAARTSAGAAARAAAEEELGQLRARCAAAEDALARSEAAASSALTGLSALDGQVSALEAAQAAQAAAAVETKEQLERVRRAWREDAALWAEEQARLGGELQRLRRAATEAEAERAALFSELQRVTEGARGLARRLMVEPGASLAV